MEELIDQSMSNIKNINQAYKIILVGPQAAGKSSLLKRLVDGNFDANQTSTIGIDFKTYKVNIGSTTQSLRIWDTAGQQKFKALTGSYFKGSHGCVCVFDLTQPNSLQKCEYYIQKAMGQMIDQDCIFLLGNKSDLIEDEDQVGRKFAEKFQINYRTVSAKNGDGLDDVFKDLAVKLQSKIKITKDDQKVRPVMYISENKSRCSC